MNTPKETLISLAAMAIAMSAMVACGPPMDAQTPKGDGGNGSNAATGPIGPVLSAAPPVPSEAECRVRASSALSAPTDAAGDVQEQYDTFFQAHHETFRCCFDALYAPRMPATDGQLTLMVKIEPTGKLAHAGIVANETTAQGPEVDTCMLEVAKTIAYPSPMNHETVGYKRTFQFKARR